MIKKYLKTFFLLLVLISLIFGIYKNPKLIFEEKTQIEILDLVDKIETNLKTNDKEIETIIQTGTINELDLLKDLEKSKSFNEQKIENERILGEGIKDLLK